MSAYERFHGAAFPNSNHFEEPFASMKPSPCEVPFDYINSANRRVWRTTCRDAYADFIAYLMAMPGWFNVTKESSEQVILDYEDDDLLAQVDRWLLGRKRMTNFVTTDISPERAMKEAVRPTEEKVSRCCGSCGAVIVVIEGSTDNLPEVPCPKCGHLVPSEGTRRYSVTYCNPESGKVAPSEGPRAAGPHACNLCGRLEGAHHAVDCCHAWWYGNWAGGEDRKKKMKAKGWESVPVMFDPSGYIIEGRHGPCGAFVPEGGLCDCPEVRRQNEEALAALRRPFGSEGGEEATALLKSPRCSVCGGEWWEPEGRCQRRCWRAHPRRSL